MRAWAGVKLSKRESNEGRHTTWAELYTLGSPWDCFLINSGAGPGGSGLEQA